MATVRIVTPASRLHPGDEVYSLGLVIAVEYRYEKIKVTFKGGGERVYPNSQNVLVVTQASETITLLADPGGDVAVIA